MPSVYDIKPAFQRVLLPVCAWLHKSGVTPNQITMTTLAASLGMGAWLLLARDPVVPLVVLPGFLFLRMAANAIDGMVASRYNLCTPLGAVLNEVGDVIADAVLYLPFALLPGIRPALPVAAVVLAASTEVAGLACAAGGGRRRHDGPMGKSDRAVVFGLMALLHAGGLRNGLAWDMMMGFVLVLLAVTVVNRCRHVDRRPG